MFNQIHGFSKEKKFLIKSYNKNSLANSIIFSGQKGIGKNIFVFNLLKEIYKLSVNENKIIHHLKLIHNNTHTNIR